jgi:hypothetical protein
LNAFSVAPDLLPVLPGQWTGNPFHLNTRPFTNAAGEFFGRGNIAIVDGLSRRNIPFDQSLRLGPSASGVIVLAEYSFLINSAKNFVGVQDN